MGILLLWQTHSKNKLAVEPEIMTRWELSNLSAISLLDAAK